MNHTVNDAKAVDLREKKQLKQKNKLYQKTVGLTQQLRILFDIKEAAQSEAEGQSLADG